MDKFTLDMCSSAMCSWGRGRSAKTGYPGCGPGGGDCFTAILQTADESEAHPLDLQDLTDEINLLLRKRGRRPPKRGLKLALLVTPAGIVLSWVKHHEKPPSFAVTITSKPDQVIKAFGLNVDSERLAEIQKAYDGRKGIYRNRE